jgi:hypothetical protein
MWFVLIGFFFLFFLTSADVAAGPLWIATRAAVEVFWGASLEVVSADMGGMFSVSGELVWFRTFYRVGWVAFGVLSIVPAVDSFPGVW